MRVGVVLTGLALVALPASAQTRIVAKAPPAAKPAWTKGIVPISPESYYNAIDCGKQKDKNPACVFWDNGLCQNPDFTLAMYTPYKMVAYEVWRVVQNGGPPPQPDYQEAQRTRITVGLTPVRGSDNPIARVVVKRGGKTIEPVARSIEGAGGRFTFDYPAFAATGSITLDLVGHKRTISCQIDRSVLARFR